MISTLYKKEAQKEKERRINKRPVDNRTSEEIFKELQKTLSQTSRSIEKPATKPVSKEVLTREIVVQEGGKKSVYQKPVPKPKYESSLKREPLKLAQQKVKSKHSELKSKIPQSNPLQEIKQEVETEKYRPDFDLRKAVIYSEILKRPQY